MCGLAGIASTRPVSLPPEAALRVLNCLRHRGPDDNGTFSTQDGRVTLLHTRLSIIDLSMGGHQPMQSADTTLALVYNGEIYNFLELDGELKASGHVYRSHSDTETILHAYQQWGDACVERLNGMFSFALWDARRQRLFCARDRFGEKPFYYHLMADGTLAFSSEIKALLAIPGVPREPYLPAIHRFLAQGLTDTGASTFFVGISALRPASVLTWSEGKCETRSYWSLSPVPDPRPRPDEEWIDELLVLLRDSVRLRLRSDVPLGTCLSGGLDSSSIVSLMHELQPGDISTFSVVYDDPELSEGAFVASVTNALPVKAHVATPDGADLHATLAKIVWHNDQPSGSVGQYSQWHAMKLASEHGVVVLLNGQGGDEIFAGYDRYIPTCVGSMLRRGEPLRALRFAKAFARNRDEPVSTFLKQVAFPMLPDWLSSARSRLSQTFTPAVLAGPALESVSDQGREGSFPSLRHHLMADLAHYSVPALVHGEDRCSMAFSREIRLPFLDHRLVEFVLDAPASLKLRGGLTKYMLRKAMTGRLPEDVRMRVDKKGYPTPVSRWLRTHAAAEARSVLYSTDLERRGLVSAPRVRSLFEDHVSGRGDHGLLLWQVLGLEAWMRIFFDR